MRLRRLFRHVSAAHWRTRGKFPRAVLDAIEAAVARADRLHSGEICFVIETALAPLAVLNESTPRARALDVFAHLRIWDTEHNNGVLIYVQLADRAVEIVADRGVAGRVAQAQWDAVCRLMEEHFRAGRYALGAVAGIDAVSALLSRHYPAAAGADAQPANQLPDRPILL